MYLDHARGDAVLVLRHGQTDEQCEVNGIFPKNTTTTTAHLKILRRHEGHRELVLVDKVLWSVLVADPRARRVRRHVLERREEVVKCLLRQREPFRVVDGDARERAALEQAGGRRRPAGNTYKYV